MAKSKAKDTASDFIGEAEGATDNFSAEGETLTAAGETSEVVEEVTPVEEMVPDPKTQIGIDGGKSGLYSYELAPAGWDKDYRINLHGQNLEHVGDDEHGRWLYRPM